MNLVDFDLYLEYVKDEETIADIAKKENLSNKMLLNAIEI